MSTMWLKPNISGDYLSWRMPQPWDNMPTSEGAALTYIGDCQRSSKVARLSVHYR